MAIINNLDNADDRRIFSRTLFGKVDQRKEQGEKFDRTMTEDDKIAMQAVINQVAIEAMLIAETLDDYC
ncbi:MAG TPA: hypothetical protein H9867_09505 [Candidatus Corynebacterium gallistercoris]|uniref:Uncharacterized protein n=1 Tax=Candidatus Corynebacterium gallistercoris TaxID=2838530 RepID=A0A9D1RYX1_9CORY|nr:hypothetical protein [Candidatus Corynebacterium gallistercoris]